MDDDIIAQGIGKKRQGKVEVYVILCRTAPPVGFVQFYGYPLVCKWPFVQGAHCSGYLSSAERERLFGSLPQSCQFWLFYGAIQVVLKQAFAILFPNSGEHLVKS